MEPGVAAPKSAQQLRHAPMGLSRAGRGDGLWVCCCCHQPPCQAGELSAMPCAGRCCRAAPSPRQGSSSPRSRQDRPVLHPNPPWQRHTPREGGRHIPGKASTPARPGAKGTSRMAPAAQDRGCGWLPVSACPCLSPTCPEHNQIQTSTSLSTAPSDLQSQTKKLL